ncbi:two-component response regulator-like APRR5 [Silene latifolia]|uniref:two-component response regulator-like APRR5 n=1 Tax=Silene latifolia TaxID=37657 RepID=UPI003D77C161
MVITSLGAMEVEVVDKEEKKESKEGSSSIVRWENFVPRSGIRILLVEADDSTRQIIGALLRKCSYKVATAPDGLKAWEVLKARPHHIDLILTEMELPSISGYALLTLIMEHEICKNIPVIMMSKYDSFSMVYKCMTKGAADFLVKPIRINELKNLWQHVWRRQSASREHGPRDSSVALDTLEEATAENNATSDRSSGSKACAAMQEGCCKKGSDAESSCGKLNLEAETAYMNETEVYSQPKQELSPVTEVSIQERVICGNSAPNLSTPESGAADTATYKGNRALDRQERLERQSHAENVNMCTQASGNKMAITYSPREAIDLIGAFDNNSKRHICPNDGANRHDSSPHLDLSLTRSALVEPEIKNGSENQMLNRSNTSAFTRYINKAVQHGSDTKADCDSTPINIKVQSGDRDRLSDNNPPPPESNSSAKDSDSMLQYGPKLHSFPLNRTVETEQGSGNISKNLFPVPLSMGGVRVDGSSPSPCSANPRMNSYNQFAPRISSSEPGCGQEHNRVPLEDQARFLATDQCASSYLSNGREGGNDGSLVSHDLSLQRSFQREAALNKFRLKRKERCFEKKVRYESRKKLAEQRPRVKGQFVRHVPPDPPPPKSDHSGGN